MSLGGGIKLALMKWNIITNSSCLLCGNIEENVDQILLKCEVPDRNWIAVVQVTVILSFKYYRIIAITGSLETTTWPKPHYLSYLVNICIWKAQKDRTFKDLYKIDRIGKWGISNSYSFFGKMTTLNRKQRVCFSF